MNTLKKLTLSVLTVGTLGFYMPTVTAQTEEEKGLAIAVEADKRDVGFVDSTANMKMVLRNRCLLYTSPSPRDRTRSRMPSSA